MSSDSSLNPVFPPELLDLIIKSLIPLDDPLPIALPASSPVTKALLVLTRTSRTTYHEANRLLYTHCLYIDSPQRLHRVSRTVSILAGGIPSHFQDVRLIHCPEHQILDNNPTLVTLPRVPALSLTDSIFSEPTSRNPKLPHFEPHKHITSLYLKPFTDDMRSRVATIEKHIIVHSIHDFITLIAPTLRRLNVDILASGTLPFVSKDPLNLLLAVRDVFLQCKNITHLCSMYDNFILQTWFGSRQGRQAVSEFEWPIKYSQPPVWYFWPKLHTLILFLRTYISDGELWKYMSTMPSVTSLVLLTPSGFTLGDKASPWREAVRDGKIDQTRTLTVYAVVAEGNARDPLVGPTEYTDSAMRVREIEIPDPGRGENVHEYPLCQEWVGKKVFTGQDPADWNLR